MWLLFPIPFLVYSSYVIYSLIPFPFLSYRTSSYSFFRPFIQPLCFYLPPFLYFLLMYLSSPVPFSLASNLSLSHLLFPLLAPLPDPFIHLCRIPLDPFFHPFDSDPWLILRAVFLPSRASLMKPRANYRISSRKSPRKTEGMQRRIEGGPLKTMNSRISGGLDKGATPF